MDSQKRTLLKGLAAVGTLSVLPKSVAATPENVLRVAMTLADVPLITGQNSAGVEGSRFVGMTIYDGLLAWDLTRSDVEAKLMPGLAESWSIDPNDTSRWTFRLRSGVKFHDGSTFDADAVVFNLDKLLKRDSPQYDQPQAIQASPVTTQIKSYRKIDEYTVEIMTKGPNTMLLWSMPVLYFSSPARWEALGRDWKKFAERPSGTGPWILDKLVPHDRFELVRNPNHWNAARMAKADRLVLLCMPEATTRAAALLSGQVDMIEAPPTDMIAQLRASGMQVVTNATPLVWGFMLSYAPDSPFRDLRIRKAANLGIDRAGLCEIVNNTATPAKGMVFDTSPWFGKPTFQLTYDPAAAKALMAEAGYSPSKPLKTKFLLSLSGSGQMAPRPMCELVQENLREVGFDVELEMMEFEAMRSRRRLPADAPENKGTHAVMQGWGSYDPYGDLVEVSGTQFRVPNGWNWGCYSDPKADEMCANVTAESDPVKQDKLIAELHSYLVDQAMWIWGVHDRNPRAMSSRVKGYVQAQSMFQDITPAYVE